MITKPRITRSLAAVVRVALAVGVTAARSAAADAPGIGGPPPVVRRLPAPGVAVDGLVAKLDPARRAAWEAVPDRLATLRSRIDRTTFPDGDARVDVEVLVKALEFALAGGEWWQPADLEHATWALGEVTARLDAIERGERPWRDARGRSVHGFRSTLDGSLQPYGIWIPEGLDLARPVPLWIWLHGRGDKETDLHFLHQRAHRQPEFMPDDAIVLLPFGRFCNGWKGPGLVDVFEARDALARVHRIDPDRVVLAGFSMGGAGAWQIGARRAGEFCAVHGGAGFVDTRRYTGVDVAALPTHEVRLWTTTDIPPVARNLLNLPCIAYSGETDKQRAAAEIMVETLAAEGRTLPHVIGAGMGHAYDDASKRTIVEFLRPVIAVGRPARPPTVHLATTTLADARVRWVEALGLGEHFAVATIDATRSDGATPTITATTSNVTALAFHDVAGPATVRIDGVELAVPPGPAARPLLLAREGGKPAGGWRLAAPDDLPPLRKRPGLTGPIDDAFTRPFIVVPPAGPGIDPAVDRFVAAEVAHFRRRWRDLFRGELPVVAADAVTDEMVRSKNLVLFGDPVSNAWIARVLGGLPLVWTRDELSIAGRRHTSTGHVPVLVQPNPLAPPTAAAPGRSVVINSGVTFREEADASNAWQNPKLPDWAVVDISQPPDGKSPGRIVDAGFCDEAWRIVVP